MEAIDIRRVRSFRLGRDGILTITLGVAAVLSGCSRDASKTAAAASDSKEATAVAVTKIIRADLSRDLVIAADFRPFQEVDVHAKVSGYVKAINVDVGDRVKEGQLLATLEIPELQAEVSESEAGVRRSEEEIKRAEADLDRAKSAHEATHL